MTLTPFHRLGSALRLAGRYTWWFVRSPNRFFSESALPTNPAFGLMLVALFALSLALSIWYLGGMFAANIDITVTVDNPDRPPEPHCEAFGDDSIHGGACDEPEEIERNAGEILREMTNEYVGYAFILPFVLWALSGTILYVAARAAGGTGDVLSTFGVAAWTVVPELLRLIAGLAALRYALERTEFTGPVEALPEQFLAAIAPVETPLLVVSLLVLCWQWYLLTAGIREVHDISRPTAAVAVGVPLAVWGTFVILA